MSLDFQKRAVAVIGLLGGVASGKSLVARKLSDLGAMGLNADQAGHEVLERPDVQEAIRKRWGDAVLRPNGEVDRSAIAKIVFAPPPDGPPELQFLERLTHPAIGQLLREKMKQFVSQGAPAIVLDAPVMLKAGWDQFCDILVFIDAPRWLRLQRAQSRGWSESEFAAREAVQESIDEKRRRCNAVIDNSGPIEETSRQVRELWQRVTQGGTIQRGTVFGNKN